MTRIFYLKTAYDISFDSISGLSSNISNERREDIKRISNEKRKCELLLTELLARYAHATVLAEPADSFHFVKTPEGKPFLASHPNCQHSSSQKHGFYAIAIADEVIGLDVEEVTTYRKAIATRFFTRREQRFIESATTSETGSNPDLAFFEIWTKKEAYVKLTGTGFTGNAPHPAEFDVLKLEADGKCTYFSKLCNEPSQSFLITTCLSGTNKKHPEYIEVSLDSLKSFFC